MAETDEGPLPKCLRELQALADRSRAHADVVMQALAEMLARDAIKKSWSQTHFAVVMSQIYGDEEDNEIKNKVKAMRREG